MFGSRRRKNETVLQLQEIDRKIAAISRSQALIEFDLEGIAGKVSEIDALATEIAAAAQEQSLGLSQINIAVNQMDQVTQQNAAMVEQTTAAAANLKSEAESLDQLINHFQTGQAMESQIIPMPGRGGLPIALKHQRDQLRVVVNGGPPSSWTEF